MEFERFVLERWYTVVFGLVPFQIAVIVVGLLCSNHITYRFGKGMMPKAYRLSMNSMAVIMDNYARYILAPFLRELFGLANVYQSIGGTVWRRRGQRSTRPLALKCAS